MSKKIILVTGATGAQGGSVARALLAEDKFSIRILTRNAASPNAIALEKMGATVVTGDMDNIQTLKNAMQGCYAVFGVTNFWEHFEKEYQHGINLIDAVHAMEIQHFVFHTLPDYNKLSSGKFPTPHCDMKAALQHYCSSLGIKATYVHTAFYYENFFTYFPLQKGDADTYSFGFPQGDTKLAMLCIEDIGGIVTTLFAHPAEYIGRTVGAVGVDDNCTEYAAILSKVLGKKVIYNYIPRDVYASFDFPGAGEIANMFEVQRLHMPNRQLDLIESHGLNNKMQSFETWVCKNKERFLSMMTENQILSVLA